MCAANYYVPKDMRDMAFMDMEIPLGYGASMWQPKLEARTVQELHLGRNDKVLEVGHRQRIPDRAALGAGRACHLGRDRAGIERDGQAESAGPPPRKHHAGNRRCGARLGRREPATMRSC